MGYKMPEDPWNLFLKKPIQLPKSALRKNDNLQNIFQISVTQSSFSVPLFTSKVYKPHEKNCYCETFNVTKTKFSVLLNKTVKNPIDWSKN